MKKHLATIKEVVFWLFVFALTLFVGKKSKHFIDLPTAAQNQSPGLHSSSTLKKINENLIDVHIESEAQLKEAEVKSFGMQDDVDDYSVRPIAEVTRRKKDYSLRLQPENAAEDVVKRLNEKIGSNSEKTPADIIMEELSRDQWLDSYDEENKKQFYEKIQQYAKEQGLQVEFDNKYRIKSVKQLRSQGGGAY